MAELLEGFEVKDSKEYKGSRMKYIQKGSGKPIVFISGWLGTFENFIPVINILSSKYTCIAVDLPGFGQSTPFTSVTHNIASYTDALNFFIESNNLQGCYYVGLSLGASLALNYLSQYSNISKAVLMSPLYKPISKLDRGAYLGLWMLRNLPSLAKVAFKLCRYEFIKKLVYLFGDINVKSVNSQDLIKYGLPSLYCTSIPALIESVKDILQCDFSQILNKINTEILLIYGEHEILLDENYGRELKSQLKNASLEIIPGGTHFMVLQKYQRVAELVSNFFNQ